MTGRSPTFVPEQNQVGVFFFKTRRKYIPVGSDAASLPHPVLKKNTPTWFDISLIRSDSRGIDGGTLNLWFLIYASREIWIIAAIDSQIDSQPSILMPI